MDEKVMHVTVDIEEQLGSIREYATREPLDVGDREFMRGHMKKLRLLIPKLAEAIEAVAKNSGSDAG